MDMNIDWAIYRSIGKRIIAVFIAQALSVLGAGSLVGIDVYQSALLAGIMGIAHVIERLARKYIDDGKLTWDEVNEVFNSVPNKRVTMSNNGNGFTQKEMLTLILEGQADINTRIDQLHEKVNQKISRAEISGWLVAISALVVLIQAVM